MFRWYCWVIFCAVLVFSTWAFPSESNVEENNLVVADQNTVMENELLDVNDEDFVFDDDDEDDDEDLEDENGLAITDRGLRKRKPKPQSDESSSSEEEKKKKKGKQLKKVKCVCYGKKPFSYTLKTYPKPSRNQIEIK